MATYVNDLRLKEIATGDESGTWGTSTNTNLELIADAFSYATKDCFATDADATETMADGVADEIRSLYLKVTSSATLTATRTLTLAPNTVSKTWIIENATTGGQSISISQGSGANVTIPNGDTKIIYTDGAGAGATVTDAFANLNVGDLTATNIAGTLTTAAQPNITSVGTLTGLDVAGTPTFDGLTVVGSGSNIRYDVASSNPHTNPILHLENQNTTDGNVAALMLSADNANGVGGSAYIYAQSETANQKGNLVFAREDGANTPVTSMKLSSNGDISFYDDTGTSQALFWDASAESLGIGTTSPANNLHIASSGSSFATIRLDAPSNTTPATYLIRSHDGDFDIRNALTSTTPLTIDSSGNVGIGTTSPSNLLELDAGSGTNAGMTIRMGTGNSGANDSFIGFENSVGTEIIRTRYDNPLTSYVVSSDTSGDILTVTRSGNVGIGTTSPEHALHVNGGTANTVAQFQSTDANAYIEFLDSDAGASGCFIGGAGDDFVVLPNASEKFRVTSSGNVGIGTSSPDEKLVVESASSGNVVTSLKLKNPVSGVVGTGTKIYFSCVAGDNRGSYIESASGASNATYLAFATNAVGADATERMRIDSSGNVGIGFANPGSYANDDNSLAVLGQVRIQGVTNSASVPILALRDNNSGLFVPASNTIGFSVGTAEAMRIDSSANLLVGTTSSNYGAVGSQLGTGGNNYMTRSGAQPLLLNRLSSNGDILALYKDTTPVGSIGTAAGHVTFGNQATGLIFNRTISSIYPWNLLTNSSNDNAIDLGYSAVRFDDIYATNGTIQTSDRNEKQDIEALTDAETRVAVAAKGLLRKFRWQSAVEEKGDEARIHFGIIAQDLQDAFTAEGLDAGDYAMFISSTWTDDDGVEQTRLGVRYSELLAFIIAAI